MFQKKLKKGEEDSVKYSADCQQKKGRQTGLPGQKVVKLLRAKTAGQSEGRRKEKRFFHRKREEADLKNAKQIQKDLDGIAGQQTVKITFYARSRYGSKNKQDAYGHTDEVMIKRLLCLAEPV